MRNRVGESCYWNWVCLEYAKSSFVAKGPKTITTIIQSSTFIVSLNFRKLFQFLSFRQSFRKFPIPSPGCYVKNIKKIFSYKNILISSLIGISQNLKSNNNIFYF